MSKPEASLWDYLTTVLPSVGHYSRIESATCHGFPDIHYSLHGYSGTIELKSGKAPFGKRGLRKTQIDWIAEEDIANGVVWIMAEVPVVVGNTIFLIDGNMYFEEFNQMTFRRMQEVADLEWRRGSDFPTADLEAALGVSR